MRFCRAMVSTSRPGRLREAALWLVSHEDGELVCPVLLNNSPDRYARVLGELPLAGHRRLRNPVRHEAGQPLGTEDCTETPGGGRSQTDGCDPLQVAHAGPG